MSERYEAIRKHEVDTGSVVLPIASALDRHREEIDRLDTHCKALGDDAVIFASALDRHQAGIDRLDIQYKALGDDAEELQKRVDGLEAALALTRGELARTHEDLRLTTSHFVNTRESYEAFRERGFWHRLAWIVRGR